MDEVESSLYGPVGLRQRAASIDVERLVRVNQGSGVDVEARIAIAQR